MVRDDGQPLLGEDDCGEFFANSMAPFTSPSASAVKEPVQNTLPVEDAKQLIATSWTSSSLFPYLSC